MLAERGDKLHSKTLFLYILVEHLLYSDLCNYSFRLCFEMSGVAALSTQSLCIIFSFMYLLYGAHECKLFIFGDMKLLHIFFTKWVTIIRKTLPPNFISLHQTMNKINLLAIPFCFVFPDNYSPAKGTLIGSLYEQFSLSVSSLARDKAEDYREKFNCWWSKKLPTYLPYRFYLTFCTILGYHGLICAKASENQKFILFIREMK